MCNVVGVITKEMGEWGARLITANLDHESGLRDYMLFQTTTHGTVLTNNRQINIGKENVAILSTHSIHWGFKRRI